MCLRQQTASNATVCNASLSHFFSVIQQIEKEVLAWSKEVKKSLYISKAINISYLSCQTLRRVIKEYFIYHETHVDRTGIEPEASVIKHLQLITCVIARLPNTTSDSTKCDWNYIQRFSPYRAVNTLRLRYKNQSLNTV